jgi:GNAT superfamily N-acetyltransferase
MLPEPVPAEPDEAVALAALIADAFADLDITRWLVPDPVARRRVLTGQFTILVAHALAHGTVLTPPDRRAVAVWVPSPGPDVADYDIRLAAVCGEYLDRVRALDTRMHAAHPAAPHAHLALLAVSPRLQGNGVGAALLAHHHRTLDARGEPAYLEASSPRSRVLYLRHGYRPHGEPFRPASGAPPMWPMWRPAGGSPG